MTCRKAQEFLGKFQTVVVKTIDARKERFEGDAALGLLDGIEKLVVSRGSKVAVFDLRSARPANDVLLGHLLGPSGNLRAPTARIGKTLVVGFNTEVYREVLGT